MAQCRERAFNWSFIRGLPEDAKPFAITSAIVSLAQTLGLEVLAEGVETEAQADVLRDLGCDTMQGYHFSRPVAAEDLPLLLSGRNLRIESAAVPRGART